MHFIVLLSTMFAVATVTRAQSITYCGSDADCAVCGDVGCAPNLVLLFVVHNGSVLFHRHQTHHVPLVSLSIKTKAFLLHSRKINRRAYSTFLGVNSTMSHEGDILVECNGWVSQQVLYLFSRREIGGKEGNGKDANKAMGCPKEHIEPTLLAPSM